MLSGARTATDIRSHGHRLYQRSPAAVVQQQLTLQLINVACNCCPSDRHLGARGMFEPPVLARGRVVEYVGKFLLDAATTLLYKRVIMFWRSWIIHCTRAKHRLN